MITSVDELDLQGNRLNTVAFLDNVSGLTTLNISNQFDPTELPENQLTLSIIDGINNMINLTSITLDGLAITEINGFKDIGITSFSWTRSDNNNVLIQTIDSTSFSNSLVTDLNLDGHELTDVAFLNNFTLLTDLAITTNLSDFTGFQGLVVETSLETLILENIQTATDFN